MANQVMGRGRKGKGGGGRGGRVCSLGCRTLLCWGGWVKKGRRGNDRKKNQLGAMRTRPHNSAGCLAGGLSR